MGDRGQQSGGKRTDVTLTGLGIALCFATGTLTVWGGMPITELTGLPIVDLVRSWTLAVQLSLSLALFAVLLVRQPMTPSLGRIAALVGGLLVGGGCALLWFQTSRFALVLSGTAIGLGQGCLLLLWQMRLMALGDRTAARLPLLSLALSAILYLLISRLPDDGVCVATVAVALVSAALLFIPPRCRPEADVQAKTAESFDSGPIMRELRNAIFCIASIAAVVLLTRFVALESVGDPDLVNISANICILVIALGVYIVRFGFGIGEVQRGTQGILAVYYALFPVIATALLLLLFGTAFATLVAAVAYAGFAVASAAIMSTSIVIARAHRARGEQVYGVLLGSLYVSLTLVTALCDLWLFRMDNSGDTAIAIVSVIVLYVLAISLFIIHGGFRMGTGTAQTSEVGKGTAADKEIETAETTDTTSTKGARAESVDTEIAGAGKVLADRVPRGQPRAEGAYSALDEIERRCVALGKQYGLTERERDIMALIVRGRDAPGIARQLHISINTVRTHSKNLYRKLDIHSKQELLDKLD